MRTTIDIYIRFDQETTDDVCEKFAVQRSANIVDLKEMTWKRLSGNEMVIFITADTAK